MTVSVTLQDGRLRLGGVIHFENAESVLAQGLSHIRQGSGPMIVDAAGLASGGSVDVAIFVQWMRAALQTGRVLRFDHISERLQAVIRVSGLTDALPLVTSEG